MKPSIITTQAQWAQANRSNLRKFYFRAIATTAVLALGIITLGAVIARYF